MVQSGRATGSGLASRPRVALKVSGLVQLIQAETVEQQCFSSVHSIERPGLKP